MQATRCLFVRIGLTLCLLLACGTAASAQTTARVVRDQSVIWQRGFAAAAAVVRAGTILTVVGSRDTWYEVAIPGAGRGSNAATGFIFKSNVVMVTGQEASSAPQRQIPAAAPASGRSRMVGLVGFGQFGYTQFAAHDSFKAVLGQAGGALFGGGAEVRLGSGFFLNGSVERFSKTGERVFVVDREVFKLGIPNTITLTPIALTTGWRFVNNRATPYVGGGIGRIFYKENSSFADAGENVDARFTSYHALGGIELRNGWVATAFEVQYSRVPGAIGIGGASAAFQESDLGGFVGRVKVLVGR